MDMEIKCVLVGDLESTDEIICYEFVIGWVGGFNVGDDVMDYFVESRVGSVDFEG